MRSLDAPSSRPGHGPRVAPLRGRSGRTLLLGLAAVLVLAAGAGMWRAATAPSPDSLEARTQAVAATLRCPTCQNLSVADSPSAMAQGMRDIIAEQLADGRSPDEVRAWFVERYGPWVLLYPPREGISWLLWLAPLGVLLAAGAVGRRALRSPPRNEVDEAARGRAEDTFERYRDGRLELPDTPAGEQAAAALQLLDGVRAAAADVAPQAEPIALRQTAAALEVLEREQRAGENAPDDSSDGASSADLGWLTRRRIVGWTAVGGALVVAIVLLLPASLGPRGIGEVPTGTIPDRGEEGPAAPGQAGGAGPSDPRVEELREAVAADPNDAEARVELADALLEAGMVEEAADQYRAALNARPADTRVRLTLALLLLQLDDTAGAQRHADRVLDERPEHPEALLIAGLAQTADGEPGGPDTLRRFLEVAPAEHPGRELARAALDAHEGAEP